MLELTLLALLIYKLINYTCFFFGSTCDSYAIDYCFMSWKNLCDIYRTKPNRLCFAKVGINDYRHIYYEHYGNKTCLLVSPITYERIKFASYKNDRVKDKILNDIRK